MKNRLLSMLPLVTFFIGACSPPTAEDASMWQICDSYPDICEATHSGALCSIGRSEVIRGLAIHRENVTSITTYNALIKLDNYRSCLEDAFISESIRNKADKQSQIITIRNIPELQKGLLESTRAMVRPEINLWLWTRSQRQDHWESMANGFEAAEQVHSDVFVALMTVTAKSDMEKALQFARKAIAKAEVIKDIQPAVYEFYVGYYLDKQQLLKAAIWQGLYSAKDASKARVNQDYFRLHEKMSPQQMKQAQDKVDSLLFDAKWLNKKMDAFPASLL